MQAIPVTPTDLAMHLWQRASLGNMNPTFMAEFTDRLDEQRLNKALQLLLVAEPVLGCRLVAEGSPRWQPLEQIPDTILRITGEEAEYDKLSSESFDVRAGPQISALLFRKPDSDLLLIRTSHESGDGASLRYCFERLAEIYSGLTDDPGLDPPVSTGLRDVQEFRRRLPKSVFFGAIKDSIGFGLDMILARKTLSLPLPSGSDEPWHYVIRQLSRERVVALSEYGRARGATLNDIILAACYRALVAQTKWNGKGRLRILCAVDLRTWHFDKAQPDAVANLSTHEFPFLGRTLGTNFHDTLHRVSSIMNRRKRNHPGIPMLLLAPRTAAAVTPKRLQRYRKLMSGAGIPSFTNLGRLDDGRFSFAGQLPAQVVFLAPKISLPKLTIAMSGYRGTITLSNAAADSARPQIEAFFDQILAELPV